MVSSSPAQQHHNKKEDAGANKNQRLRKSGVSLVPGPKPLTKHKFYLDVKNHITSGKLETKIKDLGGVLELFLVKEVTYVITDREEWSNGNRGVGSLPRTPRTPHQQPQQQQDVSFGEQRNTPVRGRPKTRADAMLERARNHTPTQQQAANAKDTLESTKTWGIPVWSIEKALAWLEKVSSGVAAEKQKPRKKCKVVELKAPHVKFEAFGRKHRPVFKEIRNWPCFNLKGAAGSAAVLHKPAGEQQPQQIMTKSRVLPQRKVNLPVQSGYCEICREEYPNLDLHLVSKKHLAYIRDNDNFLELDTLIQNGTDLESFLKLNGSKCDVLVDGPNNGSLVSHKMPRTRTSSINDCNVNKVKNVPISPTGSESGQRLLRARKTNMTYIALTAQEQEDGTQIKPEGAREARETRELRSATKTTLSKLAEQEPATTWGSGRPKRACIRKKRNSILDETIIANEQRGYYKVEMTPKLRSSAMSASFKDPVLIDNVIKKSPIPEQIELSEQYDDDKSLIVKFRRMRSSELRQLNNEAENFLFPKKDDSSSEDDIDGDCRDTTVSTHPGESIVISSETETENDDDDDGVGDAHDVDSCEQSEHSECKKRRRLTQAESFIEDNKKYYKFEAPGSRLRYHGVTLTNSSTATSTPKKLRYNGDLCGGETNREVELTADKYDCDNDEEVVKIGSCKFTLDELTFSFESIPKSEPWYETFSRQDQGAEYYTCFSDSGYWKPFLLPYQMEQIQPLDPKVCIQTYSQIKKLLSTEASSGSNSASCSTPDCSAQGSPAPDMDENSKASEDSEMGQPSDNQQQSKQHRRAMYEQRRRRKKGILLPSRNPRKSPRQHASTLAILSSLIQHRKKRKTNSPTNHTLDSIPEASESQDDTDGKEDDTIDKVAESIDDMLSNAFSDFEQVEMSVEDSDEVLEFSCKSDAIEILEDYENYKHDQRKTGLISAVRRCYSPGKKPGRKKKKNRTGWPKNNAKKPNLNASSVTVKKTISDSATVKTKTMPEQSDQSTHVADDKANVSVNNVCANVNNSKRISVDCDDRDDHIDNEDLDDDGRDANSRVINISSTHSNSNAVDCSVSSVDLEKWENAEKVLSAKITNDANKEPCQQAVRIQKTADDVKLALNNRRLRSSSSPPPPSSRNRSNGAKRARRMPASPKSPRVLRKPRGRWYRER